jgi:hypothetical protein
MMDQKTISSLEEWIGTQDSAWRAAGSLLLANEHWLDDPTFIRLCCDFEGGTAYIDWWAVDNALTGNKLAGSSGELALLRWAVSIALAKLDLSDLDADHSDLVITALAEAMGVKR